MRTPRTTSRPARRALPGAPVVVVRAVASLLAVVPWLWPAEAYACSCVPPVPLAVAIEEAEVAFAGDVVSDDGRGRYDVAVRRVLKGQVPSRVAVFGATGHSASCGVTVPRGPIVYVGNADRRFNSCSPTLVGPDAARAIASLAPAAPTTPTTTAPADPPLAQEPDTEEADGGFPTAAAVVLLGGGVAAGAAYAWWRRGRA